MFKGPQKGCLDTNPCPEGKPTWGWGSEGPYLLQPVQGIVQLPLPL